jgi:hypothetical protein
VIADKQTNPANAGLIFDVLLLATGERIRDKSKLLADAK